MKREMDRRIVYGNKGFVQEMTAAYKISEKIKPKGRQMGWRKNKENRYILWQSEVKSLKIR